MVTTVFIDLPLLTQIKLFLLLLPATIHNIKNITYMSFFLSPDHMCVMF